MNQLFRVRHNAMNIAGISGFSQIKGGLNNGCKDVYFIAVIGVNSTYVSEIAEMDQKLGIQMLNGNGFYKRMDEPLGTIAEENIAYYTKCYNEWIDSGKKEIRIKMKACKELAYRNALSDMCITGQEIYIKISPNASDSMIKNFVVKVLYWLDQVFADGDFQWDTKLSSKIVVSNVVKKQELLFWYLVSLMGNDVLLLQSEKDIPQGIVDENIKKICLGEMSKVDIPKYQKPIKVKEPQKNSCNVNSQLSNVNIKVTIPQHKKRKNTVQGNNCSERREKSYEELAQLASSVVLIAVHNSNGEIIKIGSGIMIGSKGYILTNNHVASGGRYYSVKIEDDDKRYETEEVIKYNSVLDLAVIRIQRQLNAIPIYKGETKLVRGQKVVVIGSPLGLFNSVSDGIISGFRTIDTVDMIQFTAPISDGSSGGAVLNLYGEVIGISTAGFDIGQNINLAVGYENINAFINGFLS